MNESDSAEQQSVEINNIQVADLLKYDWQTKGPKNADNMTNIKNKPVQNHGRPKCRNH